jgi:hypothetical protein
MPADAKGFSNRTRRFASGGSPGDLLAKLDPEPRAPDPDPLGFQATAGLKSDFNHGKKATKERYNLSPAYS